MKTASPIPKDPQEAQIRTIQLMDIVTWSKNCTAGFAKMMIDRYGEGPFEVVGLRLHTDEARTSMPNGHPVAITIKTGREKDERQEFSGDWFVKVS